MNPWNLPELDAAQARAIITKSKTAGGYLPRVTESHGYPFLEIVDLDIDKPITRELIAAVAVADVRRMVTP